MLSFSNVVIEHHPTLTEFIAGGCEISLVSYLHSHLHSHSHMHPHFPIRMIDRVAIALRLCSNHAVIAW
jgi:hypothetical protein